MGIYKESKLKAGPFTIDYIGVIVRMSVEM